MKKRQNMQNNYSSNWKENLAICILANILVAMVVGSISYWETTNEYAATIETHASNMDNLNKQITEVTDLVISSIETGKEWRKELPSNIGKRSELGDLIDSCIVHLGYNTSVDFQVDYENENYLIANIFSLQNENEPFSIPTQITIKYSYDYELLERSENLLSETEYKNSACKNIVVDAIAIAVIVAILTALMTLFVIIIKKGIQ